MTLLATDIETAARKTAAPAPVVDRMHWGYAIRDAQPESPYWHVAASVGRFVGTILLLAAGGLLILPDGAEGEGLAEMKLAAMVMFTVIGLYLFFAGNTIHHPEIHVDTKRGEVRVGRRGRRGEFQLANTLRFDDVASVYLLRTKDHTQPTRLFLRLTRGQDALEVASGPQEALEALRAILTNALVNNAPRREVDQQLARHGRVAA